MNEIDQSQLQFIALTCPVHNVRKVSRALTQVFDSLFRPIDLLSTQFTVLVTLGALGESVIGVLARSLGMDRTTISRELKPLIKKGFVTDWQGQDRRMRLIRLTDAGYRKLAEAIPLWEEGRQQIVELIGDENLQLFVANLARLNALIDG